MRMHLLWSLLIAAVTLTAPIRAEKPSTGAAASPDNRPAGAQTLPKGARKVDNNTYLWVDKAGKQWHYRRTPFGWMKAPAQDAPESEAPAEPPKQEVRITEKGDTLHFERRTPFGTQRWNRSKSELKGWEATAWEEEQARRSPDASAEPDAVDTASPREKE